MLLQLRNIADLLDELAARSDDETESADDTTPF